MDLKFVNDVGNAEQAIYYSSPSNAVTGKEF